MSFQKFMPISIMAPAIAIGAFTMYQHHIPTAIWIQNIACLIILNCISLILFTLKINVFESNHRKFLLPICLFLLIVTLVSPGMEDVHRWILIGFIRLNIAMIVLPITLIELYVLNTKGFKFAWVIALIVMLVLFFQPDASQLTGFAVPMMITLSRNTNSKVIRLLIIFAFSLFVVFSWMYLDNLPPVNYVESILNMVANMGFTWLSLGVFSFVILPLPFLLYPPKSAESISKYIGCYYIIIILSTLFGNFPVPLMGYGISPIIGFYISLIWYLNSKYKKNNI